MSLIAKWRYDITNSCLFVNNITFSWTLRTCLGNITLGLKPLGNITQTCPLGPAIRWYCRKNGNYLLHISHSIDTSADGDKLFFTTKPEEVYIYWQIWGISGNHASFGHCHHSLTHSIARKPFKGNSVVDTSCISMTILMNYFVIFSEHWIVLYPQNGPIYNIWHTLMTRFRHEQSLRTRPIFLWTVYVRTICSIRRPYDREKYLMVRPSPNGKVQFPAWA